MMDIHRLAWLLRHAQNHRAREHAMRQVRHTMAWTVSAETGEVQMVPAWQGDGESIMVLAGGAPYVPSAYEMPGDLPTRPSGMGQAQRVWIVP